MTLGDDDASAIRARLVEMLAQLNHGDGVAAFHYGIANDRISIDTGSAVASSSSLERVIRAQATGYSDYVRHSTVLDWSRQRQSERESFVEFSAVFPGIRESRIYREIYEHQWSG